jgi:HEAT repeat protein
MGWWTRRKLQQQLQSDSAEVRKDALLQLAASTDTRAMEPLRAAVGDEDVEVRRAAVAWLALNGNAMALTPLSGAVSDSVSRGDQVTAQSNTRQGRADLCANPAAWRRLWQRR